MKKQIISIILLVAVVFSLSGCVKDIAGNMAEKLIVSKEKDVIEENGKSEPVEKADEAEPTEEKKDTVEREKVSDDNLLEDMSADEKRKLNTFLSNFSESFYGISTTDCVEDDKIFFAFIHNLYNVEGFKPYTNRMERGILAEEVDATLEKYFGSSVPHETTKSGKWEYREGYFIISEFNGEGIYLFSIATDMTENADGTFKVDFTVFEDSDNVWGDPKQEWYGLSYEEAMEGYRPYYPGWAVIRPKIYEDKNTYEMVEYSVDWQ